MFYEKKNPDFDEPEGCFETGNTRPPKGRHGMLAAVLLSCALVGALVGSLRGALERMRPNVPSPDASQPVDPPPSQPTERLETTPAPRYRQQCAAADFRCAIVCGSYPPDRRHGPAGYL